MRGETPLRRYLVQPLHPPPPQTCQQPHYFHHYHQRIFKFHAITGVQCPGVALFPKFRVGVTKSKCRHLVSRLHWFGLWLVTAITVDVSEPTLYVSSQVKILDFVISVWNERKLIKKAAILLNNRLYSRHWCTWSRWVKPHKVFLPSEDYGTSWGVITTGDDVTTGSDIMLAIMSNTHPYSTVTCHLVWHVHIFGPSLLL